MLSTQDFINRSLQELSQCEDRNPGADISDVYENIQAYAKGAGFSEEMPVQITAQLEVLRTKKRFTWQTHRSNKADGQENQFVTNAERAIQQALIYLDHANEITEPSHEIPEEYKEKLDDRRKNVTTTIEHALDQLIDLGYRSNALPPEIQTKLSDLEQRGFWFNTTSLERRFHERVTGANERDKRLSREISNRR